MSQPLSPAAQAVLNALLEAKFGKGAVELGFPVMSVILGRELAAALRALADQASPSLHIEDIQYQHQSYVDGWKDALDVVLAIAVEVTMRTRLETTGRRRVIHRWIKGPVTFAQAHHVE